MARHPEWPSNVLKVESPTNEYEAAKIKLERFYKSSFNAAHGFEILHRRISDTLPSLHRVLTRNGSVPAEPQNDSNKPRLTNYLVKEIPGKTENGTKSIIVAQTFRLRDTQTYQIENFNVTDTGMERNYRVKVTLNRDSKLQEGSITASHFSAEEQLPAADGDTEFELMSFNPYDFSNDANVLTGFDAIYKDAISDLLKVSVEPTSDMDLINAGFNPFDPGDPDSRIPIYDRTKI